MRYTNTRFIDGKRYDLLLETTSKRSAQEEVKKVRRSFFGRVMKVHGKYGIWVGPRK